MSNCLLRIISFLLLTLAGGTTLIAQNNAYGINDDLYRIFSYASDNANHVEGLEAADSMYRKAVDMSDGKSMCLALTVPLRHYSSRDNLDSLLICVERLNHTARATGNLQYSYFAETSRIIYHLRRHSYNEAIKSVNNIWHQAFDNDTLPYGRCAAIQSLGHLYVALNDRDLAIRQYKEALGYLRKKRNRSGRVRTCCKAKRSIPESRETRQCRRILRHSAQKCPHTAHTIDCIDHAVAHSV